MKKYIILLTLIASSIGLNATTITVENKTNAMVNAYASGPSWESGDYKIAPGDQAFIKAPGLSWFVHIKDADNLSPQVSPIEMHFGINEQGKDKIIEVKRADATKNGKLVEGQFVTNRLPNNNIAWRVFSVNSNKFFQTAHDKGDYDNNHTGYIPANV
ncbi:MAG: hypothetical protein K2X90_01625 [Candidatus Babeliaceae bacterium]|nr:hypothetical protein [Candidatus Babeliaceae bacterium]